MQDMNAGTANGPRYTVSLARTASEIEETQRLRYRIFSVELGAKIDDRGTGLDRDRYDAHCRHLQVRDAQTGHIVACTRLLTDDRAMFTGGFYSGGEFDLRLLEALPGRALEVGRTCVEATHRNGAVIATLWSGLAQIVNEENFSYLFGCASIGMEDGGGVAHAIVDNLRKDYLAPAWHRVTPRRGLPAPSAPSAIASPRMPPLLKAYVSLGAKACGEAYYDEEFNCADVFMLLNVGELAPRYARRFFGRDTAAEPGLAAA